MGEAKARAQLLCPEMEELEEERIAETKVMDVAVMVETVVTQPAEKMGTEVWLYLEVIHVGMASETTEAGVAVMVHEMCVLPLQDA